MRADVLLVGGGLANGLIALRLRALRPELRVVLVEREARLGGSHTWSFHTGDLDAAQRAWLEPLVRRSWPCYDVRFPGLERRIAGGYHALTSESLEPALSRALGEGALLGCGARDVRPDGATLDDGREIEARCVIDGRGFPPARFMNAGFQKFLGLEVELAADHGLEAPLLMDATVPQEGGFRFVYVLPLGPRTALVEDTCYADDPALEPATLRERIGAWAEARGWHDRPRASARSAARCRSRSRGTSGRCGRRCPRASPAPACAPASFTPPPATRCPRRRASPTGSRRGRRSTAPACTRSCGASPRSGGRARASSAS